MKNTPGRPPARILPLLSLTLAAVLAASPARPAGEPATEATPKTETGTKNPVVLKRVAPEHPLELAKKMINGRAVIECIVTDTGVARELKILSATHPEFGEAAQDAVSQWEFRPGEKDGQPVAVRLQIPFEFILSPEQIIESALQRTVYQEIHELVVPAREMPSWPRPVEFLLPRYPESLKGSGKYGKAVVSIVINKEGKVMNPRIVKATYPEFMLPALAAAARLEFPPQVMANNERIHVSMDIQFDFKADSAKPKDKDKPAKK